MTEVFSFAEGTTPLLISIPHDGRKLMPGQAERMTTQGRTTPDTDWFVKDLYAFAGDIGASTIAANYSRYVVDLNRPASDDQLYAEQVSTGLCPLQTFAGEDIYLAGEDVSAAEKEARVQQYWRPYHDELQARIARLTSEFGYALLWDAHSIASEVPRLFPGVLTDLNIGTNGGGSCGNVYETAVMDVARASDFSSVSNGRFRGGFITRHYGNPGQGVHAIQLELSQRCYMTEKNLSYDAGLAVKARDVIRQMLAAFMTTARENK
ncbi:MAG: N-formylglutamate deformylase [Woeseiaceae bacterium]